MNTKRAHFGDDHLEIKKILLLFITDVLTGLILSTNAQLQSSY